MVGRRFLSKKPSILVARALVTSQQGRVPVRVLNLSSKSVTVYKGNKIARGELVEENVNPVSVFSGSYDSTRQKEDDQIMVENLMGKMPTNLDQHQCRQVRTLLTRYAHIFARKSSDLGRTNVPTYRIYTTGGPIRQSIRRMPPLSTKKLKNL